MSADRNAESPHLHESIDLLIADALERFDQSDVEGAVTLLKRATELDPEHVVARRCLEVAQSSMELVQSGHSVAAGRVDLRSVAARAMVHQLKGGTVSDFDAVGDEPIDIGDPLDETVDGGQDGGQDSYHTSESFDPDAHRTAEIDLMAFDKGHDRTQELQLMSERSGPSTKALAAALEAFELGSDELDIEVDVELDAFNVEPGEPHLDSLDATIRDALLPEGAPYGELSPPEPGMTTSGKFQPRRLAPRPPRREISDEELEHKLKTTRPSPPPMSTGVVRYQGKAPPPPKHRRGPVRHTQASSSGVSLSEEDMRTYRSGAFALPLRSSSSAVPAVTSGSGEIGIPEDLAFGAGELHTDLTAIFESDDPLAFGVELSDDDIPSTSLTDGFDPWADLEEQEVSLGSLGPHSVEPGPPPEELFEQETRIIPARDLSLNSDSGLSDELDLALWPSEDDSTQTPQPSQPSTNTHGPPAFAQTVVIPPVSSNDPWEAPAAATSPLPAPAEPRSDDISGGFSGIDGDSDDDAFVMEFDNNTSAPDPVSEQVSSDDPSYEEFSYTSTPALGTRSSPQNKVPGALAMSRPGQRRSSSNRNAPLYSSNSSSASSASYDSSTQIDVKISQAWELHQQGKYPEAQELIRQILSVDPDNVDAQFLTEQNQVSLESYYLNYLGDMELIARLALSPAEVMRLRLDSRAGYLLSQIDGNMTLNDLLSFCPMTRLEALELLAEFLDRGIIVLV